MVGRSAASLGFGVSEGAADEDVHLVLVDNGSTDGTLAVMGQIARRSRPGSVWICKEPERGFVPPRRRGTLMVAEMAQAAGAPAKSFLILQADADTIYLPDYARWMTAFLGDHNGILLEGAVKRDAAFDAAHPAYRVLEQEVDGSLDFAPVADQDEIIIDDKTCGYRLSDYLIWGGHLREYNRDGSEIHAETTRLLLRARLGHGATKVRVNPAQAVPSRRRILEDPALHFGTAGFPREESWLRRWRDQHPRRMGVEEFAEASTSAEVQEACFYRRAHHIALFWLLPWVVRRAREGDKFVPPDERAAELLSLIGGVALEDVERSPGSVIMLVLAAIEEHPTHFR